MPRYPGYPDTFPPCVSCGSSRIAPSSWRCGLCRSHAALWQNQMLTEQDVADLVAVREFEQREQRRGRPAA